MDSCCERDKDCVGNGEMIRIGCLGYNLFAQPCGKVADPGQAGNCGCDPDRLDEVIEKLRELEEKVNNIKFCECGENPGVEVTLQLSETSRNLVVGDTFQLQAIVGPADLQDKSVTWISSDPSIATVDQDGNVTAIGVGTVTITATTNVGGKSASCEVVIAEDASENVGPFKYLVMRIDIDGDPDWVSDGAMIAELELFNRQSFIPFTVTETDVYDSSTGGAPTYWNAHIWDKSKLNNGQYVGENFDSACMLLQPHRTPGVDIWLEALLILDDNVELTHADMWIGTKDRMYGERRLQETPHRIAFYGVLGDEKPILGAMSFADSSSAVLLGERYFDSPLPETTKITIGFTV